MIIRNGRKEISDAGWSSLEACRNRYPEVGGSNPPPAIIRRRMKPLFENDVKEHGKQNREENKQTKRELLAHYVDINMVKTAAGSGQDYHLIGEGVESLSEEFNSETETKQWINQANGNTDVKSYTPNIDFDMEDVDPEDEEMQEWVNEMVDTLPTGSEAVTSYIRVRLKNPTGEGVYKAVKRMCAVSVGSTGGDAGANVTNSISLGGKGDGISGTFNVTTNTFTPGEPSVSSQNASAGAVSTQSADVPQKTSTKS